VIELVPLGELGEVVSGSTPKTHVAAYWDGDIPWITPADLSQNRDTYCRGNLRKITRAGFNSCSTRMLPAGSILFSSRAPIGHCAIAAYPLCTNQGFKSIIPNQRLDSVYGYYALRYMTPVIVALGRGATFAEINKETFESVRIPVPTLDEQKRIAALLDKADRLRRSRRYAQELSDSFLQSVFLQMFDQKESCGWAVQSIESLAKRGQNTIRTGPFGSQLLHSKFTEDGVAVLGIDNAVQNRFVWDKRRFIAEEKYRQLKRYTVYPGDVLITIMGTCGRCAVVPDNIPLAINTKHLCCITLDQNKCQPVYLQACFLLHPLVRRQLGISERGAIMPGLNMGIIKDLMIPIPPLPRQAKFTKIVKGMERLHAQQREVERQAEHLFQTLLHRAFSSEHDAP